MKWQIIFAAVISILATGVTVFAGGQLTAAPAGNGVILITGQGVADVAGMDITVGYDPSSLANPRVVPGAMISGSMFAANAGTPGSIRIAIINDKAFSGSGPVATITFDQSGTGTGNITGMRVAAINVKGKPVGLAAQVLGGTVPQESPAPSPSPSPSAAAATIQTRDSDTSDTSAGKSGLKWLGGVSMPQERGEEAAMRREPEPAGESSVEPLREQAESTSLLPKKDPPESSSSKKSSPEKKVSAYPSVLSRFKNFTGDRSPSTLEAIFDMFATPDFRQEPSIALSDGNIRVKVYIRSIAGDDHAPNFALSGARLVKLGMEGAEWVLEVLPDKDAVNASVTLMQAETLTEIPLTVAPPLAVGEGAPPQMNFQRFFKEPGTLQAPRLDFNRDGRRDYVDDYIFTANYLLAKKSKPAEKATEGKQGK